jgi:hypothetical protein
MLELGVLPAEIEAPPGVLSEATRGEEDAEGLRSAIAYCRVLPGPAIPHRIFGPLIGTNGIDSSSPTSPIT